MRLSQAHINTMIQHAQAEAPNEACGVLEGVGDTVAAVHCLENADHSPYTYELTPAGYLRLAELDDAERLLAVFHSHLVTAAYPSPTDRSKAFWPVRYVLVSLQDSVHPSVRIFRISKRDPLDLDELGEVVEEQLEIE